MRLHMAIPSIVINTRVRIFSNAYTIRVPTMARKAGSYYDTSYCATECILAHGICIVHKDTLNCHMWRMLR